MSEYVPWPWTVSPTDPAKLGHCPSASATLGNFAAVNAIVSVLSAITGNRKVVNKLTCGWLGSPDSRSWTYMWIVTVGLQLAANAIIAVLMKHTAGYEDNFSVTQLVLFYTARPRISWIFLTWLSLYTTPLESKYAFSSRSDAQHWEGTRDQPWGSAAKSTLIAEIVLALISLSIYGRVAHYGATAGYYKLDSGLLSDAKRMYAGAMVYVVTFCVNIPMVLNMYYVRRGPTSLEFMAYPLLILPWIGSWLFWAGYVKLEGNSYCPPSLITQASLWVSSSAVGVFLGTGF